MHRRQGLIGLFAVTLAGCAGTVGVPTAVHSTDPDCSRALVAIRGADTVAGSHRVQTGTQATAAWGDDGRIQLRCGLDPLGPTTARCQRVAGVDWVSTAAAGRTVFTAFGRTPTLAVSVDDHDPPGIYDVLSTLSPAAGALPANGHRCL